MSARVLAEQGPVRVLVNNAGVDRRLSLDETDDATWRWMLSEVCRPSRTFKGSQPLKLPGLVPAVL